MGKLSAKIVTKMDDGPDCIVMWNNTLGLIELL
jgi:hypothetical protein